MDLTGYKLTFDDEFNSASVSNDGPQNGTLWTNHFWYNGNQGGIETDLPGNISVANGAATIAAQNTGSGWTGGVLSSVDSSINGFTQEYGYFEMRAQMPSGSGAWPAFWLPRRPPISSLFAIPCLYRMPTSSSHSSRMESA